MNLSVTTKPSCTHTKLQSNKFAERYIPNRASSNLSTGFEKLEEDKQLLNYAGDHENNSQLFTSLLQTQLFNTKSQPTENILKYSQVPYEKENKSQSNFSCQEFYSPLKSHRKIPKSPYKVLDAPALQDDFYLNLLDWSPDNLLSVGLGSCVYIWNASNAKVHKLCDLGYNDSITTVAWSQEGPHLTVGTHQGTVFLWDISCNKLIRSFAGHTGRVGTAAWNSRIFSTASRDRSILNRDIRSPSEYISRLTGHKQEVCGLKWSFDETQLCSGGNDNKIMLWTPHSTSPTAKLSDHKAAVKALAWSPHQNGLLVSGGGTADRTIKFWNTLTNEQINSVDTGSQVCNVTFSKTTNELVSTHGYSMNQVVLWKYPGMSKVATLTGHTYRVLYLAMSPDGETIVTGAGDETLRFWKAFPSSKCSFESGNSLFPSFAELR